MHSSISSSAGDDDLKPLPAANQRRHKDITRRSNNSNTRMGGASLMLFTVVLTVAVCAAPVLSSPALMQQQQQQQQQQPEQQQQQQTTASAASQTQTSSRTQQCREGCFEKFATKESLCQQNPECLTCWQECAKPPPPKINKSIRETWTLHTVSMLQQDSLVLVDVAWSPLSTPNQCLVTWEVSGGGLMGNLLTESYNVQLSLWPETKYRVQVTCKNKLTGFMSRSLPLSIDTAEAEAYDLQRPHQQAQAPSQQKFPLSSTTTNAYHPDKFPVNVDEAALSPINSIDQDIAAVLPYEEDDTDDSAENDMGLAGIVAAAPADSNRAASVNEADSRSASAQEEDQMRHEQHTNFIFNWHARKNADISAIEPLHKPELSVLSIGDFAELQKPLLFGVVAGTVLLLLLLVYVCLLRQARGADDKAALIEAGVDEDHAIGGTQPPALGVYGSRIPPTQQICRNPEICSRNNVKV